MSAVMTREKGSSLVNFVSDYTVIDIETTGFDPRYDEIIEIGAIRYRGDTEVDSFQALVRPYQIISEFITDLEASGVPLNVARQLMGHADVTTTARIYTHKSDEPITKALENIDELNRRRAIYRARIAANVEK